MTSEENKIEELLKPRYKVIANYPNNVFNIGYIHQKTEILGFDMVGVENIDFSKYPAIFEPLPWYAERKVEDMPEILKSIKQDFVCRPIYHEKEDSGLFIIDEDEPNQYFARDFLPCTEQEYQSYISKTKQ